MQTLLPLEQFKHAVNLQPIEVENKNSLGTRTSNEDITSAIDPAEPYADPEKPHTTARNCKRSKSSGSCMHPDSCISQNAKQAGKANRPCEQLQGQQWPIDESRLSVDA